MIHNVEIKKEIANICNLVYDKGMVCGSGGNISARQDNTVFITPSGYSLGEIRHEDIVEVTIEGKTSSSIKPSMELSLHMEAYKVRPDINVVIHIHSLYATIAGIMAEEKDFDTPMPPYTPGYVMKINNLKEVAFYVPGSKELAHSVGEGLKKTNALLMKNHGIVVVEKSFREALNIAEEIEQNARIHTILGGRGCLSNEQLSTILEGYK